ncbi:spermatogenesis-defective protein 39 homolog isoform X1 [Stegodyphus dumicola]|uniref:spermatogenesis-defective protein 39 homolog isoform X1 n=2 Tax=Stegodyphus dumicola TaxID=202533 RepID=UPI0015AA1946|nr:spermatogenesis-defective protein 39 homolog isoform X1 [Stegodyphus dumicola]XP_035229178.1 spermatogenesis-defective protein 39 homolog isoform X1 [Stegodyphus dumicola]XP_035229185.1 spermatogenesis-defective protein 39 homolog isoform X1 [Stegodyphus dumicola]
MDRRKGESDEDYWTSAHRGFDFGESSWDSRFERTKLSSSLKNNDNLNQYELFKCDGLNEAAENEGAEKLLTFHMEREEEDMPAQKLAKSFSPLECFVQKERGGKSPSETIKNMIFGYSCSLEPFKSRREKIELLSEAVKYHDGNVILAVVMFLRNTLKRSVFHREIQRFPDAINIYLSYLEEDHETDELTNMLLLLGKPNEAAMLKYEAVTQVQSIERKLKLIENCLSTHFLSGNISGLLISSVQEHKEILEEQLSIEKAYLKEKAEESDKMKLFKEITGERNVVDSSVMSTLIFYCLHHHFSNEYPLSIFRVHYRLSNKQYTWAALRSFAAQKQWKYVDELFMSKTWLGSMKIKSPIGYSILLQVLSEENAPTEVLTKYINSVENEDLKMSLAKKYRCHSVVIEMLKNKKDRLGLIEYATILPQTTEFYTISDILNNPGVKWKN